jgi:hypothetical protein
MPKDYHSITIGDPYGEIKKAYYYRDGHVCKNRIDVRPETIFYITRNTNPKTGENWWLLKGRKIYDSWAKENLSHTPNPQ